MGDVCTAVFDMDARIGDLRPDMKFAPPAVSVDRVPDWVNSTRQVQGRICPDDPDFGFVYGRLGVYGADMPVHPQLQKFTADIEFGDRFTDDEPVDVTLADGTIGTRAMFRIGFKHLDSEGFEAQASQRRLRRVEFASASQDPGSIDMNDPHRMILTGRFIRDEVGVWVAAAAHPSTTFADYRKAIGSDFSGDYFGAIVDGMPQWWASWVSIVGAGATENVPQMAAAASAGELWACGSYVETKAQTTQASACDGTCGVTAQVSTADELSQVTAERDALAGELAAIRAADASSAVAAARQALEESTPATL